eukprot:scaffold30458_cov160-Skeletonema_menzelii.AAC.1
MTATLFLVTVALFFSHFLCVSHGFFVSDPLRCRHSSACRSSQGDNEQSTTSIKVGIIGAGSIAFGTASLMASLGHDPMLWSPGTGTKELIQKAQSSDAPTITSEMQATGSLQLMEQALTASEATIVSKIQSTGALSQEFDVRIAHSARDLVRSNDNILVVALPVNCHKN